MARRHHQRWYWAWRPVRGTWGLEFDKWMVRRVGISIILAQVSAARHLPWSPALLLTTTGRTSGEARSVVLPYVPHEDNYLLFGSNAGGARHPQWVLNLLAQPRVSVTVQRRTRPSTARVATSKERADLLAVMRTHRPHVVDYEASATAQGREIALVVVTPVG